MRRHRVTMQYGTIDRNVSTVQQSLMEKLRIATETSIPLDANAELVYTERKDGVMPGYDIRTDRFAIAQEQMQAAYKSEAAKRDARIAEAEKKVVSDGVDESMNGTEN